MIGVIFSETDDEIGGLPKLIDCCRSGLPRLHLARTFFTRRWMEPTAIIPIGPSSEYNGIHRSWIDFSRNY